MTTSLPNPSTRGLGVDGLWGPCQPFCGSLVLGSSHARSTRAGKPVLGFTCRGKKIKQRGNLGTCWMWVNLFSFMCSLNNIPLLLRNIVPWVYCHLWIKTDTFLQSGNLSGFLIFIYWKKSDPASRMIASPGVKQLIQCQFLNACYLQFQL